MAFNPNKWGPATTQKDFEFLMEGETCVSPLTSLLEHALTSPSQELSDPVTAPVQSKVRGRIVTVNRVVRGAEQTGLTYTMLFPSSFWTPALNRARQGGLCYTDFYARYLCPELPEYEIAYIYPESLLDQPSEVNDFITNTTDTEVLSEQTTLRTTERKILWAIGVSAVADQVNPLNAVAFNLEDCVGCTSDVWVSLIAGGAPTALASPFAQLTENRFTNVSAVATGIPVDSIITGVYSSGDVRLYSFSDGPIATGTVGGVAASFDGGLTWALDTNITAPMYAVGKFNDVYIAVGGTGAGIGLVYSSTNGLEWTAVTSTALSGTTALYRMAVDTVGNAFYFGGEGGKLYKGTLVGGTIDIDDISANLPTVSSLISAIAVLAPGHVAVGAAAGYVAESFDAGADFNLTPFTSASAVTGIDGTCYRTVIGAGTKVYERSILTSQAFKVLASTFTGDVTDVTMAPGDFNYFVVTTDDGEVLFLKPHFPNA